MLIHTARASAREKNITKENGPHDHARTQRARARKKKRGKGTRAIANKRMNERTNERTKKVQCKQKKRGEKERGWKLIQS